MTTLLKYFIPLLLCLTACGHKEDIVAPTPAALNAAPTLVADDTIRGGKQEEGKALLPPKEESRRYIALRHSLLIETAPGTLQANFEATTRYCEQLHCQILSASFNRESPFQPPSASLSARIPPAALEPFLAGLNQHGTVLQHRRESEDKTDAVIDAEARIKNLTELRDRLRSMLSNRSGSIKDVIEVERELAKTQAELDSIAGVRKALANETELVAIEINFQAQKTLSESGLFSPVAAAWDEAGHVLMNSLASLITFVAAVLPWMAIVIPVVLLLRRLWRRRKVFKA